MSFFAPYLFEKKLLKNMSHNVCRYKKLPKAIWVEALPHYPLLGEDEQPMEAKVQHPLAYGLLTPNINYLWKTFLSF